jgi:hypothetical protein
LTDEQLQSLVSGAEASGGAAAREHVAGCRRCAARLAMEARVELALQDLGQARVASEFVPSHRQGLARLWRIGVPAAAAAVGVVLAVWLMVPRPEPRRDASPVMIPPPASHDTPCLQDPRMPGPAASATTAPGYERWADGPGVTENERVTPRSTEP